MRREIDSLATIISSKRLMSKMDISAIHSVTKFNWLSHSSNPLANVNGLEWPVTDPRAQVCANFAHKSGRNHNHRAEWSRFADWLEFTSSSELFLIWNVLRIQIPP